MAQTGTPSPGAKCTSSDNLLGGCLEAHSASIYESIACKWLHYDLTKL